MEVPSRTLVVVSWGWGRWRVDGRTPQTNVEGLLQSISLLLYSFLSPISDCVYAYACLLGSVGAPLPVRHCLSLSIRASAFLFWGNV